MEINLLSQLYSDFMIIIEKSVIKYKSIADEQDTLDIKKSADAYITASLEEDTFNTYYRYNTDVLTDVLGLTSDDDVNIYYYDRNKIPVENRNSVLLKQREYIINNYVEKNDYYRCFNGLPNLSETETDWIYLDESICNECGLPNDIPIHLMSNNQIALLSSVGYLNKLILEYPDKKYLSYLGAQKIDIVTARTSKNFSVIRIPSGISESTWNNFARIYEQCREYFMSCIYIPEYRQTIDFYDNFIAMCIMVMTVQQIISRVIKSTIERDFFDDYAAKVLFNVYGVPYNLNMDSVTRLQILQNLNLLVQNKGTNKVIFDIASILGYDRLQLYKYYLVKARKFDTNGIPIVAYKDASDGDDSKMDYQKMFDIYFQKIYIDDIDTYHSLDDKSTIIPYQEVVENDPYWIEDDDLNASIYETEYNYVESKYMGASITYRLTNVLLENVYLLKMILEKKDEIGYISIELPKISLYENISLFDAIVLLCAITCKQNGLKGEILTSYSKILQATGFTMSNDMEAIQEEYEDIMGINFSMSYEEISDMIHSDPDLDDSLCDFFMNPLTSSADRVNELYTNYTKLQSTLVEKMSTTNNVRAYQAYRKLYNAVFYTKENQTIFNITSGEDSDVKYASTYLEYLEAKNPELAEFVKSCDKDTAYSYINHISSKLLNIISDLKYIGVFSGNSNVMERVLVELINFFKSYTVDMVGVDIIFVFDLKPESLIRMIDMLKMHVNTGFDDEIKISYQDQLSFISRETYSSRTFKYFDEIYSNQVVHSLFDNNKFTEYIHLMHSNMGIYDKYNIRDSCNIINTRNVFDLLKFIDGMMLQNKLYENNYIPLNDIIYHQFNNILMNDFQYLYDNMDTIIMTTISSKLAYREKYKLSYEGDVGIIPAFIDANSNLVLDSKVAYINANEELVIGNKVIVNKDTIYL